VEDDVPVDSEVLLVTDFVNLKIKPAQFFRCAHRGRVCVLIFIEVSARTCMSILFVLCFSKKILKVPKYLKLSFILTLGSTKDCTYGYNFK
jgi:hypothetical protein